MPTVRGTCVFVRSGTMLSIYRTAVPAYAIGTTLLTLALTMPAEARHGITRVKSMGKIGMSRHSIKSLRTTSLGNCTDRNWCSRRWARAAVAILQRDARLRRWRKRCCTARGSFARCATGLFSPRTAGPALGLGEGVTVYSCAQARCAEKSSCSGFDTDGQTCRLRFGAPVTATSEPPVRLAGPRCQYYRCYSAWSQTVLASAGAGVTRSNKLL